MHTFGIMTQSKRSTSLLAALAAVALGAAACAPAAPRTGAPTPLPAPRPAPAPSAAKAPLPPANPRLPVVPDVRGPLAINVIYPKAGTLVASRDSNFIFGSVGNGDAALSINGVLTPVWPNGSFMGWLPVPTDAASRYEIVAIVGSDTARVSHPVKLPPAPGTVMAARADTLIPVDRPTYAVLGATAPSAQSDTDRVVIGRPERGGAYRWFLFPNTAVRVTGLTDTYAQVQLDRGESIWIEKTSLTVQDPSFTPPSLTLGPVRAAPAPQWIDVVVPATAPPAFLVEEGDNAITLTVYGATVRPAATSVTVDDSYMRGIAGSEADGRQAYTISLAAAPYGYLALWQDGALTLRVRRPPRTSAASPLRGLTIAVDPGHPPVGATGPTGLWEPIPTLQVGFRVRDMLAARGANVVMTRVDDQPVELGARPIMARRVNAHALVSIHFNALPDGQNPFRSNGTSTYYFQPHSKRFAQMMQQELLLEMGLRDIGARFGNLALVRPTWMPAVLAEGAFIMMPDQEAAIRTPQYQDAYARGIVKGLERFFSTFAGLQ